MHRSTRNLEEAEWITNQNLAPSLIADSLVILLPDGPVASFLWSSCSPIAHGWPCIEVMVVHILDRVNL